MENRIEINGKTSLIGLLGNPVEHTLSPVIHNGISKRMGINSVYVPFHVEEDGLANAVKGAYELNILGLNVTVPYKSQVMESLLEIDEAAKAIGAVNTLVRVKHTEDNAGVKQHAAVEDTKKADREAALAVKNSMENRAWRGYKGYNTDMSGLQRQLREDGISLKGKTVVILGAGGAAKAVLYMCLLEEAGKIYLLNRTLNKAEAIAKHMSVVCFAKQTAGKPLSEERIIPMRLSDYAKLREENLIVFQATSIGLYPHVDDVVIDDPAFYNKVAVGIDLIYNPADTRFMQMVRKAGGTAFNALKMLLYQGVIAYELWHDIQVPCDIIKDVYVDLKRNVYPKDNIVLIGFMGSGKTTFGKALAKRLDMGFLDTDEYIEKQAGMSISDIFKEKGEAYFRQLEHDTLIYLREHVSNTVFATGGGMPLSKENARLLKEIGYVCYLTAASVVIYERVKDNTSRPLLQGDDPFGRICNLMKERQPLYEAACDAMVDTNSNDLEEIIHRLRTKVGR